MLVEQVPCEPSGRVELPSMIMNRRFCRDVALDTATYNCHPVKRLPSRFVYVYGKARSNGKLPPAQDERNLALARSEPASRHEGPLASVWPSSDFDVKDLLRSDDEEPARTVEKTHRWIYRAQQMNGAPILRTTR